MMFAIYSCCVVNVICQNHPILIPIPRIKIGTILNENSLDLCKSLWYVLCCMKGVQHMRMIEELFYGNICPCEKSLTRGSEYSQLLNLAVKNEEKFYAILSPQQKEMFEKVKECMTDMNNILEKEAFIDGFRLGVKLIAEAVYDMSGDI